MAWRGHQDLEITTAIGCQRWRSTFAGTDESAKGDAKYDDAALLEHCSLYLGR